MRSQHRPELSSQIAIELASLQSAIQIVRAQRPAKKQLIVDLESLFDRVASGQFNESPSIAGPAHRLEFLVGGVA